MQNRLISRGTGAERLGRPRFALAAFVLAALAASLAACGGGGGGGFTPPTGGVSASPTPTSSPTLAPNTTNASGIVVDDANGNPLPGVHVALMPWGPCGATPSPATSVTPQNDGCPTPLPSPQATTDASGAFTLNGAPNGHYLLVVGSDVPQTPPPGYIPSNCVSPCASPTAVPFAVQAVVHDNVTLTGGNQTLKAPTLPPVPMYTPPAWETNGDYRLSTIDPSYEAPCYVAWEYERAKHNLGYSTVDEWLMENIRASNYYRVAGGLQYKSPPWPSNPHGVLTTYGGSANGTANCDSEVTFEFNNPGGSGNAQILNPRDIWFGGQLYNPSNSVTLLELPVDPRSFTDPNVPNWP